MSQLNKDELNELEGMAVPKTTKRATQYGVQQLKKWMAKRNIEMDFHKIDPVEFNNILRRFYAELKSVQWW